MSRIEYFFIGLWVVLCVAYAWENRHDPIVWAIGGVVALVALYLVGHAYIDWMRNFTVVN